MTRTVKPQRPSRNAPDPSDALLALCREIVACQECLSNCAVQLRPHLQAGAEAENLAPVLQRYREEADRLQALVSALGKKLREASPAPGRREEVRRAVEDVKTRLAQLVEESGDNYTAVSRRGVRIPGVGGRPYTRKR